MNSISNLLKTPFSTYTLEEKLEIKRLGRPLPNLNIVKDLVCGENKKRRRRSFNPVIYSKNNWICGSEAHNSFFCFPCVLFGDDITWARTGSADIVHIWEKMTKHEVTKQHLNSSFSLAVLGKTNIKTQLNSAYRQNLIQHNAQVDRNRHVLNIMINCIRFCGALEMVLKTYDETDECRSKGVFRDLIDFSSEFDKDLKLHFSKSSVFKDAAKDIQDELLQCMLDVYHEEVIQEIKNAEYVAVIADETTDITCDLQLAIILRYIVGDKPVERFWKFVKPNGHDTFSIAFSILQEIDPLIKETPNKLIAQSYDGAALMSGGLNGVQKIIKERYPRANYVHCYAHQINLILASTASINKQARIFFAHLSGLCSFLSSSPQVINILDEVVLQRCSEPTQIIWDFQTRGINTIYEYRNELIQVMEILENSDNVRSHSTIAQAGAYKHRLTNKDFVFWLTLFYRIMPYVGTIFHQLQQKNTNPLRVKHDLRTFEKAIQRVEEQIEIIITEIDIKEEYSDETVPKRGRLDNEYKKMEAIEVCDAILQQIKARFNFTGHLVATNLFLVENFTEYHSKFPEAYLTEVADAFPFLDKHRLKGELQVLYERQELKEVSGTVPFRAFILEDSLRDTFRETLSLLSVLMTIPMPTSEDERCFSTLERIKTCLKNTYKYEQLNAVGMLAADKAFLNRIDNFNKKVIDLFASKEGRMADFSYRKL